MITEDKARSLATHWVQAWNSHDLAEIMSHYAEDVVLVSPVAARILNDRLGYGERQRCSASVFQERA